MRPLVAILLFFVSTGVFASTEEWSVTVPSNPGSTMTVFCPNAILIEFMRSVLTRDVKLHPNARYFYSYSSISRGDGSASGSQTVISFESGTSCVVSYNYIK